MLLNPADTLIWKIFNNGILNFDGYLYGWNFNIHGKLSKSIKQIHLKLLCINIPMHAVSQLALNSQISLCTEWKRSRFSVHIQRRAKTENHGIPNPIARKKSYTMELPQKNSLFQLSFTVWVFPIEIFLRKVAFRGI